jgi:uncharacterized damage-inducible protein DinB
VPESDARGLADIYRDTTARITELLTRSDSAVWGCPVPACPGWSVRDVVSHMVAVADDWASGQLTGPPTDEETAEHARRFGSHDGTELLGAMSGAAASAAPAGRQFRPRAAAGRCRLPRTRHPKCHR